MTLVVLLTGCGVLLPLSLWLVLRVAPTGDEPWYLLQADALVHWHRFDLAPALRDRELMTRLLGNSPDDHTRDYLGNGERMLVNLPGYAAAIAPLYALGGRPLIVAVQAIAAAATGALVFSEARKIFGSRAIAVFAWLAYLVSLPVMLHAGQIFPSTFASLLMFAGFVLIRRTLASARGSALIAAGAAVGLVASVLPWLHIKYALAAVTLIALALATVRVTRVHGKGTGPTNIDRHSLYAVAAIAGPPVLSFGLIALYSHRYFGTWTPPNALQQPDLLHPHAGVALGLYGDMFANAQSGLIPWVPLDLLVIPGLILLARRYPRDGIAMLALLLAQLGIFVTAAVSPVFQGKALPARFTVECAPFFALSVAALFAYGYEPLRSVIAAPAMRRWAAWSVHRGSRERWLRGARAGVALGATVLLGVTLWLSVVGQSAPATLYPSPYGIALLHRRPALLPRAWFALFPLAPNEWASRADVRFRPAGAMGEPVRDATGAVGYLAAPSTVSPGAVLARTDPTLMPAGRYRASFSLACDPGPASGEAARVDVRRVLAGGSALAGQASVTSRGCAGVAHPASVEATFTADGAHPVVFEVVFGGAHALVAWSVSYAPR